MTSNTTQHLFLLPNHWEKAVKSALETMGKNGNLPNVIRCEINDTLTSFNKFQLQLIADSDQLLQLGVYIGTELSKPEPLVTIGELEAAGKIPS